MKYLKGKEEQRRKTDHHTGKNAHTDVGKTLALSEAKYERDRRDSLSPLDFKDVTCLFKMSLLRP